MQTTEERFRQIQKRAYEIYFYQGRDPNVTYSVPSTERLLNAKHFSRLPPKSVARQEALWQDTLREGSVRALCQAREYNSSGLTCHLKEAVRARNSIAETEPIGDSS